jgi:DNA uptake protein ComE-like DNA-binding protein
MARAIGLSGDKPSKDKTLSAQNTKILESKEVNINTASKGELEALEGVGPATAATIVKIREDKPFTSVSDLNERVALPRSAKWDSLKSVISFG